MNRCFNPLNHVRPLSLHALSTIALSSTAQDCLLSTWFSGIMSGSNGVLRSNDSIQSADLQFSASLWKDAPRFAYCVSLCGGDWTRTSWVRCYHLPLIICSMLDYAAFGECHDAFFAPLVFWKWNTVTTLAHISEMTNRLNCEILILWEKRQ